MVDTLFWMLIAGGLIWFVAAPQKIEPLQLITHAVLQYLLSLLFWTDYLNSYFTGLLWVFLVLTSLLLFWAPRIPFGRERYVMEMFFRVGQWSLLLGLLVYTVVKSPFSYQMPGGPNQGLIQDGLLFVRPFIKLAGNLLIFTAFFHLILHGSQRWTLRKSLWDLGPIVLYLVLGGFIRFWQVSLETTPLS